MAAHAEWPAQPYVLKLKPKGGESLLGYMHRLAARNKHDIAYWIRHDIGLKTNTASLTERQLANLSIISGRPIEELAAMQSEPAVDGCTTFMAWSVPESEIERGRARLCPACIADDAYHRQIWNLRIATVCPLHGGSVIDECPVCAEPLTWRRVDLFCCMRGHNLKRHQRMRGAGYFPSSELLGVRALYEKCGVLADAEPALQQLPDVIRDLDLVEFMAFLVFVGRVALRDKTRRGRGGAPRYDANKTHRILQAGFDIARNWPASFATILDELRTEAQRQNHQVGLGLGLTRVFRMFDNRDPLFLEVVKRPIREYVTSRHILLQKPTRRLLAFKENVPSAFVSATEAGKIMGCCEVTARKVAIARGWCSGKPGAGQVMRIPRSEVEEWARQEATITLSKAGGLLGLGPAASIAILRRGLLQCVPCCTGEAHPRGCHVVRESEVDRLLDAIQKSIRKDVAADRGVLVSWYSYQRRYGGEGLDVSAPLKAMLEGRLVSYRTHDDQRSFDQLCFHLLDLIDACADEGARNSSTAVGKRVPTRCFVSINDAARIADMHQQSICRALELKLIKADHNKGPRSAFRIELSGLRTFIQNHSTAGKLARQHNLHFTNVCRILERLHVQPIGNKKGRYCQYPVYSSADLRRVKFTEAVAEFVRQKARVGSKRGRANSGRGRPSP